MVCYHSFQVLEIVYPWSFCSLVIALHSPSCPFRECVSEASPPLALDSLLLLSFHLKKVFRIWLSVHFLRGERALRGMNLPILD